MFSKNKKFRFQNILTLTLFGFILGGLATGETIYEQLTESSIDDMTSETVATLPTNRSRTTIGIGEEVVCEIDSDSWEDKDCKKVDDGPWTDVNDTIGDRVWACSSGGTVSPSGVTSSDSTTLTADQSPDICVVGVDVYDSEDKYDDDEIYKSKTFTIIAPDGLTSTLDNDNNSIGTAGPPNNQIGCSADFLCTVSPTSVNFYNASFQENIPDYNWTWPDGNDTNWPGEIVTWGVETIDGGHNRTEDNCSYYFDPISRLDNNPDPNVVNYVNHTHTRTFDEEYLNQDNDWIVWLEDEEHPFEYLGSNQSARTGIKASNTAYSGYMGPWQ